MLLLKPVAIEEEFLAEAISSLCCQLPDSWYESRHRMRQTGLAVKVFFLAVNLSRHVLKIYDSEMAKKQIVCFGKI